MIQVLDKTFTSFTISFFFYAMSQTTTTSSFTNHKLKRAAAPLKIITGDFINVTGDVNYIACGLLKPFVFKGFIPIFVSHF